MVVTLVGVAVTVVATPVGIIVSTNSSSDSSRIALTGIVVSICRGNDSSSHISRSSNDSSSYTSRNSS